MPSRKSLKLAAGWVLAAAVPLLFLLDTTTSTGTISSPHQHYEQRIGNRAAVTLRLADGSTTYAESDDLYRLVSDAGHPRRVTATIDITGTPANISVDGTWYDTATISSTALWVITSFLLAVAAVIVLTRLTPEDLKDQPDDSATEADVRSAKPAASG